jgi:predicted ester cyclase
MKNFKFLPFMLLITFLSANIYALDINENYDFSPKNRLLTPKEQATKQAALNYAKFWNTGKEQYLKQSLHQDFIDKNLPEGRAQGIEGPKNASVFFRNAIPDLTCEIEELYIVEDRAIVRYRFKGNFSGSFGDTKGKSQIIDFSAIDMYKVKQGKIIENWHLEDNLTLMKQLELVKLS